MIDLLKDHFGRHYADMINKTINYIPFLKNSREEMTNLVNQKKIKTPTLSVAQVLGSFIDRATERAQAVERSKRALVDTMVAKTKEKFPHMSSDSIKLSISTAIRNVGTLHNKIVDDQIASVNAAVKIVQKDELLEMVRNYDKVPAAQPQPPAPETIPYMATDLQYKMTQEKFEDTLTKMTTAPARGLYTKF